LAFGLLFARFVFSFFFASTASGGVWGGAPTKYLAPAAMERTLLTMRPADLKKGSTVFVEAIFRTADTWLFECARRWLHEARCCHRTQQ
jgi:hypothetical protein